MISPNKLKNLDVLPCSGFILRGVRGGPWIDGWKEWGWRVAGSRHCSAVACPSGSSPENVQTHIESEVKLTYLHNHTHLHVATHKRLYKTVDISVWRRRASRDIYKIPLPLTLRQGQGQNKDRDRERQP